MLKLILWLIYCGSFYPIPGITHIGEITYLIHEIPDDDLSRISLRDGTIAEWKEIFGPPSLQVEDFTNCPTVPWSGSYDPTDLSWSV